MQTPPYPTSKSLSLKHWLSNICRCYCISFNPIHTFGFLQSPFTTLCKLCLTLLYVAYMFGPRSMTFLKVYLRNFWQKIFSSFWSRTSLLQLSPIKSIFWFLKPVLSFISYGKWKTFWENNFFYQKTAITSVFLVAT